MSHLMNNYGRLPISFDHGQGVWLWDKEGNKYLDVLAGIAVNSVGHAHPRLVRAISDQAAKLIHCSNYFNIDLQEQVAEKLVEHSGLDAVFFCNSGLEANECAIKIARKFGHLKGIDVPHIIVMKHAFHGRSIATLSATGNPSVKADFSPYTEGFIPVEEGNLEEVEKIVKEDKNVVAILFEPILGEGGVIPLELSYMRGLRELCDQNDILMMCDEIQSGVGRSGKWFAHQRAEVKPDVMTLAKGLAGGVPVGAVVVSEKANILKPGNHGSTFGGNPVCAAAAQAVLEILDEEALTLVAEKGDYLRARIEGMGLDCLGATRGLGLMIGIEVKEGWTNRDLAARLIDNGLLILTAGPGLRMLPPLVITKEEMDRGLAIMEETLS